MAKDRATRLMLEDVKLDYRNFSGKPSQYNRQGERNFVVLLDEQQAEDLSAEGWNVKIRPPREEGDAPKIFLPVAVNFNGYKPPRIVVMTGRGRTTMDEADVGVLDWAYIEHADLIINPYHWEIMEKDGMKSGIKAYLDSAYITIQENPFEEKYSDLPDLGDDVVIVNEMVEEEPPF